MTTATTERTPLAESDRERLRRLADIYGTDQVARLMRSSRHGTLAAMAGRPLRADLRRRVVERLGELEAAVSPGGDAA